MKLNQILRMALVVIASSILIACQAVNSSVGGYFDLDTDIQIEFVVDADINPDESGKASPLFIRLYELSSKKMMKRADFIEIYERDKEVLGSDMVAVHKLKRLIPGEGREEHIVLDKKTNYVALYAEFLDFKEAKYKLIIPVVANNVFRDSVVIRVSGNKLIFDEEINEEVEEKNGSGLKEKATKTKDNVDKAS